MHLMTAAQTHALDRRAIGERGIPSLALMERAAQAVADATWRLADGEREFTVVCGTGNNGGDGLAAARLLLAKGGQVRVLLVGDRAKLTPDAAEMERRLLAAGGTVGPLEEVRAGVVVDALFGVGLTRPVTGGHLDAVRRINASGAKVVSVDLPSGVETDTGRVLGEAVRADVTVTFTCPKPGLLVGAGGALAGEIRVADIGIPADLWAEHCNGNLLYTFDQADILLPHRPRLGHKGDFGRLYILAGSVGYTGAPILAASAALRSGVGLITLGTPAAAWPVVAGKCLEVMAEPLPDDGEGKLSARAIPLVLERIEGRTALLLGPGLGRSAGVEAAVWAALEQADYPVVLDADGLNAVAAHIDRLKGRGAPTVLTPHEGEFARLGGDRFGDDRLGAARAFAAEYGCILVRKGHRTITAFPDGRAWVNTTGNPGMAKGGSGDVLAGLIASLLAQGFSAETAVPGAVWLHGRAGDLCAAEQGEYGMTPGDMVARLPQVLQECAL